MNEKDLNSLFEKSDEVVIDPAKKRRAINVALAEFASAQASDEEAIQEKIDAKKEKKLGWLQGLINLFRPTEQDELLSRRNDMAKFNNRWIYGAATASVVLFAGFIAIREPRPMNQGEDVFIEVPIELQPEQRLEPKKEDSNEVAARAAQPTQEEMDRVVGEALNLDMAELRKIQKEISSMGSENNVAMSVDSASAIAELEDAPATLPAPAPKVVLKQSAAEKVKRQAFSRQKTEAGFVGAERLISSQSQPVILEKRIIDPAPIPEQTTDRERFEEKEINPVKLVSEEPVSTFSIDVDTSSYSFARRKLNQGFLPEKDAVRVEEFLNYFDYDYPNAESKNKPFSTNVIVSDSPWKPGNKLLHIGIKGYEVEEIPKSNLVFLLDVSGSMSSADKLPLVKQSIGLLLDQLRPDDTVAIAVYAGAAGTVLEPTEVKEKQKILSALNKLNAGGSTAGAAGIKLAYQLAEENFDKDAVNRIILATDGDFNVGISEPKKLKTFVERKRDKGIFLSVLGFGQGNYYDHLMQSLAQNGNGVAAYIDTLSEAQKLLVNEATSSLFPIAKDVKIQIEFNPATVAEYRLIGYETRHLNREDFNNDKVDAGDIGSGHTVTAIYEITPVGSQNTLVGESRYAKKANQSNQSKSDEYALLKLRYKMPDGNKSKLIEQVIASKNTINLKSKDKNWQVREFQFASAVAGFAQLIKDDKYMGEWDYDDVIELALKSRGDDIYGYRNEFVQLVRKAKIAQEM